MKESVEVIQRDGYSEPLLELGKRRRIQMLSDECVKKDNEHAYVVLVNHKGWCWYEGIAETSSSVLVELSMNGVVEVNAESHELLRVNGEDVNGIEHAKVLDLSDDGERWEGDVTDGKPFGWGVLYDSEGEKKYEGFRIGGVNVCYGRSYYSDIQKVQYEGMIFEGKRWGRGVLYDRDGNTVFEGEWMNDEPFAKRVELSEDNQLLHSRIEKLIVSNNSCNGKEWSVLDLSVMSKLRLFEVGDECFMYVKEVKLIGLNQLERVVIGKMCFTTAKTTAGNDPNRHFYLKNCERLRELKMGHHSFSDYTVCEIENVDSLEVIEIGGMDRRNCNFYWASELKLKSGSDGMT